MKFLFKVEEESKDLSEFDRLRIRQKYSKPRLKILLNWLLAHKQSPDILPDSSLGKAISYCLNQWDTLILYADVGFVEAHNNNSENGLRSVVLGKNNWLFAGSVDGGRTAAIWMSVIQTCHRLEIDPFEYIKDVLTRLPATPTSMIDEFLPDRWKASNSSVVKVSSL